MITAICVPADLNQPIRLGQIKSSDISAYRRLVGNGSLEAVRLDRPEMSLYLNEEGKLDGLEVNPRATVLVWAHNSQYRGNDTIVGDAFIVGGVDRHGDDKTAPDVMVKLLTEPGRFKYEVHTRNDEEDAWTGNALVFDDVFGAYIQGVELAQRWMQVEEVRVVPES